MRLVRRALFAVAVSATGPASSLAHDHWINHGGYASPRDGIPCCGDDDCFLVPEESVRITAQGYALRSGEQIPFREALVSEDGRYWRCQRSDGSRRCFFAPPGGV
jgi:hypothetical protein